MANFALRIAAAFVLLIAALPADLEASHISGIRITQTGNTGLMINIDVTAFYTTGSTETTLYLGTYYNQAPAIDWGDGSTVPRYGYGPSTGIPLVSTSTVVNGIPARAYRGSFSHSYGAAGSYTIAARTGCCPLTTPTYTLVSGTILTTTVNTTGPFGQTTFTTSFVENTLQVDAIAPGFSKAFAPADIGVGAVSTLTFTIDNTASTLDDNLLDFTDSLPSGVQVATSPNAVNSCTGGTVTATAGSGSISYTGGSVTAGATCTISVDVTGTAPGSYLNTSGDLTSAFGNSGTASDTLTVSLPPAISASFSPGNILPNEIATLTFTIDNTSGFAAATGLNFNSVLPNGMEVASAPNPATTCGGNITAPAAGISVDFAGGTVGAGATCTVSVDITITTAGDYEVTADLGSSLGNSTGDSGTLGGGTVLDVPTLGEYGLLALIGLLGLFAVVALRRRP